MALGNFSIFRPKHVDRIEFGDTAWSNADFTSTTEALDTTFDTNNGTPLVDLAGDPDTESPTKSYPFARNVSFSGNERTFSEINLLGADTNGQQNQELGEENTSLLEVTLTLVYRNNVPLSIFNDTTECCIMTLDNEEATATGILNVGFNNIKVTHVGSIEIDSEGEMTQQVKFTLKGGTTGSAISVNQSSPSETWERIVGGDYAEEVRLT